MKYICSLKCIQYEGCVCIVGDTVADYTADFYVKDGFLYLVDVNTALKFNMVTKNVYFQLSVDNKNLKKPDTIKYIIISSGTAKLFSNMLGFVFDEVYPKILLNDLIVDL